jgi:hypothetical protein
MSIDIHRAAVHVLRGILAASLLTLAACPPPIVMSMLNQQKDTTPPAVTITFPTDGSSYPSTVVVTGTAVDFTNTKGTPGKVVKLRYDFTPASIPGQDIISALKPDGTYSFQFPTAAFSGAVLVTVTATDWDGNKATASITLVNNGSVPSFGVAPGNHQVTLTWSPVPLAQSYSVYYTSNGTPPSPTNGTVVNGLVSGVTLPSLQNGAMYSFLLQAHSSSGPDNWSNVTKAIPLSTLTLAPQATTSQYGQVTVSWKGTAANTPVQVFRSLGSTPTGFFNLTGPITGTSFVDFSVTPGQTYWYQVVPASYSTVASAAVPGMASPLTSLNKRITNTYSASNATDVAVFSVVPSTPPYYAAVVDGNDDMVRVYNVTTDPAMSGSPSFSVAAFGGATSATAITWDGNNSLVVVGPDASSNVRLGSVFFNGASISVYGSAAVSAPQASRIYDVRANGSLAFVAEGYQGVQVWDYITTRATPVLKGAQYNPGAGLTDARSIALHGAVFFLAAYNHGVMVFDINGATGDITPRTFGSIQNLPLNELLWPTAVTYTGAGPTGYLYVADAATGLVTISFDITLSPGTFATLGTLQIPGVATHIAEDFTYGRTYIASYDQGLQIVNSGNPAKLAMFDSYQIAAGRFATRVALSDKFAYAVDGNIEVVNPNTQIESGTVDPAFFTLNVSSATGGSAADVKVEGSTAYVAASSGLNVYDVSSPASPVLKGSANTGFSYGYMAAVGSNVYVAAQTAGLQIFDVSTPTSPALVGSYSYPSSEYARDVALDGDYALIADNANGLLVVDVSTPASPVLKARYPTPSAAFGVKLVGTTLYVFDFTDMQILDVTDPTHPIGRGQWRTFTGVITGGDVVGNYAYVAATGLVVLDISNPLNPVQKAASYPFNQTPLRVKVVGSFAFASSGAFGNPGGLQVYDITNPLEPVFKGFYYEGPTTSNNGLDVSGNYVFFADDTGEKSVTVNYTPVP